jgi:DNA-binding beta-propeller fold protein YncE
VPERRGPVRSVAVGAHPHDAAAAGDRIFAGDEFGSAVSVVRHGREVRQLPAARQPGSLAVLDGDTLGVVCVGSQQLRVFDVRTGRPEGVAVAGAGPTHLVPGARRRFYVVDTRGDAIVVFGLAGGLHVVGRVPAPGAPYGIAIDPVRRRLWVTETARNHLAEWALGPHRPVPVAGYPTVRQPNAVAVDPATGRVAVAGAARGELQLLDPPR